jgi:hypothetical protein
MDSKTPNNVIVGKEVDNNLAEHAACEVEYTPDSQLLEIPQCRFEVRRLERTHMSYHTFGGRTYIQAVS